MEEIRIGVAGLGHRGLHWIRVLQRLQGYRVTALFDPITALHERAVATLTDPRAVKVYGKYEDFLADPNMDAVALCVRCEEQGALAAQALEAGKHVNSEVPAAHRLEDCWRIVVAQEKSGKVYQLAEQTRYWGFVEAWTQLVRSGQLGRVLYCEGQYIHYYVGQSFQDPATGRFYHPSEIHMHPEARPTWITRMPPIHYLPHELSPMLKVMEDRVAEVVGMGNSAPSYCHPELDRPDLQVALMKTEKDAVLRMVAGFSVPQPARDYHWYQIIGTNGCVEWRRSNRERPKLWLNHSQMHDMAEVDWQYARTDAPAEARGSGHGDADYYVHATFRDAVLHGKPLEFDVYKAMDTAAPAILAAESIAQGSIPLTVPDFRPSSTRPRGSFPS
jgi:predicted dehydrogenase